MSEQDFTGTWNVTSTSGTPFGVGTTITIGGGTLTFDPSVGSNLGLRYDEALDLVAVEGVEGIDSPLYLAVYIDPEYAYRALYGIAIVGSTPVTFAAAAQETPSTITRPTTVSPSTTLPPNFVVKASSGTQFGLQSRLEFEGATNGITVTLVNALGDTVSTPTLNWIGPVTLQGVYQGAASEDRLVMQCSFAEIDKKKRTFGLAVVGDPENSGVWGGDEEEPSEPDL